MIRNSRSFIFFLLFSSSLVSLIYFPYSFFFLSLPFLILVVWKLLFSLSGIDLIYSFLVIIEIRVLSSWLSPFWLSLFTLGFIVFLFGKIFLPQSNFRSFCIFHYLLLGWVFLSLGIYFLSSLPFALALASYLGGVVIFFSLAFLLQGQQISRDILFFLLLSGEFFWLSSYFSIKILPLSLFLFVVFWLLMGEYEKLKENYPQ